MGEQLNLEDLMSRQKEQEMQIEANDKYRIESDKYSMWVVAKSIRQKGKQVGTEFEQRVSGYFRNAADLLEDFVKNAPRESEAQDVKTILEQISERERAALSLVKEAVEREKELKNGAKATNKRG